MRTREEIVKKLEAATDGVTQERMAIIEILHVCCDIRDILKSTPKQPQDL